jgi:hypothetical protein
LGRPIFRGGRVIRALTISIHYLEPNEKRGEKTKRSFYPSFFIIFLGDFCHGFIVVSRIIRGMLPCLRPQFFPGDVTFSLLESTIRLYEAKPIRTKGVGFNHPKEVSMKKKWWILLGSLVIIAVIGFTVVSHAGRHFSNPMGLGHMYRLNLLSEELGLTDDQRTALKDLIKNHRQEIKPLVKTLIAKKRALQELALGEDPDPGAIPPGLSRLGQCDRRGGGSGMFAGAKGQIGFDARTINPLAGNEAESPEGL